MNQPTVKSGSIEVICGSMFSGKTEELLRRMRRANIAKQSARVFKPRIDTRYDKVKVVSHDDNFIDSFPVKKSTDLLRWSNEIQVIGIDEAQFFDEELPRVCNQLANDGARVVIAGLDMDYLGKPFDNMAQLLAIADKIDKVKAICMKCGKDAIYSFRLSRSKKRVLLGEKDAYEPRCRSCYVEDSKGSPKD